MKPRKRHSTQFKAAVVLELLKEEKSLSALASEHAIHPNQLREWRKVALAGLPQLFERDAQQPQVERAAYEQHIERLYTEIGRLSSQLSWLQKKSGVDGWTR
jgi:transposase-like protein